MTSRREEAEHTAHDELQRDPPQLMADFIGHTKDACRDLQFYSEWCLNHDVEPDPVISAFINVLVTFRRLVRAGVAPDGELRAFDVSLGIRVLAKAVDDTIPLWQPPDQQA